MVKFYLNIYSGTFKSQEEAIRFVEWVFSDTEDLPTSKFLDCLGLDDLSLEYVEAIWGEERFQYLRSLLIREEDLIAIKNQIQGTENTFFLVMELFENRGVLLPKTVSPLRFCGRFQAAFKDGSF